MKNTNKTKKSQRENQLEPLIDLKSTGKRRDWDKAKRMSLAVASAYSQNIDLEKYGEKIKACAKHMRFKACKEITHGKKLVEAYFCKCRQCVTCQGLKANFIRKQVIDLTHEHLKKYSTDVPLLLTLTILNEPGSNMIKTVDKMTAAWKRLMQLKVVKRATRSWFRSLEITYNPDRDDFHPHFHAVLMVPHNYFRRKSGLYITRDEWLRLWQQCMRDDRITQVDIRRLKPKGKGELEAFVGEAAKYATKPSSYILENEIGKHEADPKVVSDLHYALRGRRLVAYGGYFSQIRKERKMVDVEKADLVNEDGEGVSDKCHCKICKSELVEELYRWNFGVEQYLKEPLRGQEDEAFQEAEVDYEDAFSEEEEKSTPHYADIEEVRGGASYDFEEVRGDTSSHFEEAPPLTLRIDSKEDSVQQQSFSLFLRGPP